MSLNQHLEYPALGTFTLEDLGLSQSQEIHTKDPINDEGVLGEQKVNQPDAVIDVNLDPAKQEHTMAQSEIEAIPSWDSKIRLISDHASKIVDMSKIQQDIEGSGKLNQHHTDVIEATFEGFYSDANRRVMYTSFESRTGLSSAQDFMAKRLKASLEALSVEYADVNTNTQSEMAQDLLKSREFCIYDLRDMINEASANISAVRDRLCAGPIILPLGDDTFVDMTNVDMSQLDAASIRGNVPLSQEFLDSYAKMVEIWKKSPKIREWLDYCMSHYKGANPESITPDVNSGLYLATIVPTFGEWASETMYEQYVVTTDQNAKSVVDLLKDLDVSIKSGDPQAEAITKRGSSLSTLATKVAGAMGDAQELGEFAQAAAKVTVGLASLR